MDFRLRDYFCRGIDLVAALAAGILLFRMYAIYACVGLRLNQDEAEHFHVAFALERGERPYLDFIENHPMLFNLAILAIKRAFPQDTVLGLYMIVRLCVFLAAAACIHYVYRLCADYCRHEPGPLHAASVFLLVFVFCGILPEANSYLWDARPDWFCYLLSLICIHAHFIVHGRSVADWTAGDFVRLGLGGAAGGLATAVLAKSLYIFAPYALVAGLVFARRVGVHPGDTGRLFAGNVLFVGMGILIFCIAVAAEIYMTGATLDAYYKANYVINRTTHLVSSLRETPISQLIGIAGVGVWPLLAMASAAGAMLLASFRNQRYFKFHTLVFSFSLVGFNTLLLTATNGAYWIHNFVPSILGFIVLVFVLLHGILTGIVRATEKGRVRTDSGPLAAVPVLNAGHAAMLLFVVVTGLALVARVDNASRDFDNLKFSRAVRDLNSAEGVEELLADRLLPSTLTYLVFSPDSMPLRARHWGYYFMLAPDKGFWNDNFLLGIGPDPSTYWQDLYAVAPPDAVLFSDISGDLMTVRERLLHNQKVDISWLEGSLKRDYICIARSGVAVFVRREHMAKFNEPEWKQCGA